MNDASSYWSPICKLKSKLRCWVRMRAATDGKTWDSRWGQLLTIPTEGYLEGPGGPIPLREVEWVEISVMKVKGGIFGRPRELVDIKDELLSALRVTQSIWELRDGTWSIEGIFSEEPVQVVRILNPFRQTIH